MRKSLVIILLLISCSLGAAETTYHCSHYQKDINYWQAQYGRVVQEKKSLLKQLMEAKNRLLESGIKINVYKRIERSKKVCTTTAFSHERVCD